MIEHEFFVHIDHPMTKEHYISFIAYVTADRYTLVKLYPEQEAAASWAGAMALSMPTAIATACLDNRLSKSIL